MLTLAIGIIVTIVCVCLSHKFKEELFDFLAAIVVIITAIIVIVPLNGYEEPIENKINLLPINGITINGNCCYIIENDDNKYMYASNSRVGDLYVVYKENCIKGNIVEYENMGKPVLIEQISKPKKSLFTLNFAGDKITYTFYVPEGSVKYIDVKGK